MEDEKDILDMICRSLGRAGYKVYPTQTCSEGFKAMQQEQPLLLLTDNFLPDDQGRELIRKIKGNPATSGIKTILMTAGVFQSAGKDTATPDYLLQKPFALRELNAVINSMLG